MARDSMYADDYIDSGLTISTYLAYRLRGKAKQYGGGYYRALTATMDRWVAEGRAYRDASVSGQGTAYYSRPQSPTSMSPTGAGLL